MTAGGDPITNGLTATYSGFSFIIPDGYAFTPLLITFNTIIVEEAGASAMTNTVTLKWGNGTTTNSNTAGASGAKDFKIDNFATATKAPYLQVLKTSTNTSGGDTPAFKLGGAVFTLTPMKEDSGTWVADGSLPSLTKTTSSSTGLAYFFLLKKNMLYRLTETAAPIGYALDSTPRYFVFTSGSDFSFPESIDGVPVTAQAFSSTGTNRIKQTVADEPTDNATVSFIKQSDTGMGISGVSFTLTDKNDKLNTQTANSNQSGIVTFNNVDPGTYTLTETTPGCFYPVSAVTVTVTATPDGYTVAMGSPMSGSQSEGYVLTNNYIRGTVSLTKTDAASGERIPGAEFTVYLDNGSDSPAAVAYLLDSDNDGVYTLFQTNLLGDSVAAVTNTYGDPVFSDQDGTLMLLAGGYYVTETVTPEGYLPDLDDNGSLIKHPFTISGGDGSTVSTNDDGSFENTPCGIISGTKSDDAGSPVLGAVIGLFAENTTEFTEENALYTTESGDAGIFTFTRIPYGTYVVAEVSAPYGYDLNTTTRYTVTVDQNDEQISTGEMSENGAAAESDQLIVIVDNRTRYSLTINKTAQDRVKKGFSFLVTCEENDYSQTFVTGSDGIITVTDLLPGTYTVTEINVPRRYRTPRAQTAEVIDQDVSLSFYNRLRSTGGGGSNEPDEPDDPDEPTDPNTPDNPDNPGTPSTPETPTTPTTPAAPTTPTTPGNPDTPGTTTDVPGSPMPEPGPGKGPDNTNIGDGGSPAEGMNGGPDNTNIGDDGAPAEGLAGPQTGQRASHNLWPFALAVFLTGLLASTAALYKRITAKPKTCGKK